MHRLTWLTVAVSTKVFHQNWSRNWYNWYRKQLRWSRFTRLPWMVSLRKLFTLVAIWSRILFVLYRLPKVLCLEAIQIWTGSEKNVRNLIASNHLFSKCKTRRRMRFRNFNCNRNQCMKLWMMWVNWWHSIKHSPSKIIAIRIELRGLISTLNFTKFLTVSKSNPSFRIKF